MSASASGEERVQADGDDCGAERMFLDAIIAALGLRRTAANRVRFDGADSLPSAFAVTALASASIGAAALTVSELVGAVGTPPPIVVDRRLASMWFAQSIRPIGWSLPSPWDPIAGDYLAADGWIRLHTNPPRHRATALRVLGSAAERPAVAEAVKTWAIEALETAVVEAGGCLVDVRLDAYGWTGPWRNRRGFDSLVQMSTGIAAAGMIWRCADKPVPLPVQALDHATGYMIAAAAVRGLNMSLSEGRVTSASLSLARTAALLMAVPREGPEPKSFSSADADYSASIEATTGALRIALCHPCRSPACRWPGRVGRRASAPRRRHGDRERGRDGRFRARALEFGQIAKSDQQRPRNEWRKWAETGPTGLSSGRTGARAEAAFSN